MRVVINSGFGTFGLSRFAFDLLNQAAHPAAKDDAELLGSLPAAFELWECYCRMIERHDPQLLAMIDEHGLQRIVSPSCTGKVVELPDGTDYMVIGFDTGHEAIVDRRYYWE